jgi:small subunit ribosomal protein S8
MFTNILNGQMARRSFILQTRKAIGELFLKILWDEGFILGYSINTKNLNQFIVFLKYKNERPIIESIKFVSKPACRVYYSVKQLWKIDSSKSFLILSTNKGLKSVINCKKLKIGGEPYIVIN